MRWKTAIATAVLASVLVTALIVTLRPRPRPRTSPVQEDTGSPLHFFVDGNDAHRRLIDCGASESAHRIGHLRDQQLFPCRFETGWIRPSPWGTWSNARRSRLTVVLEDPAPRRLVLECRAQPHRDPDRVQTMTVEVNDRRVAELEVPSDWKEFSVALPADIQRRGENVVSFEFGYLARDAPTDGGRRQRVLSVNFKRITLLQTARSIGNRLRHLRRSSRTTRSQVWDGDRDRFVLSGAGHLVLPMTLPEGESTLELELRVPPDLDRNRSRIFLTIDPAGGSPNRTVRLPIEDTRFETASNVLRGQIQVAEFAGLPCIVGLDVNPTPRSAVVEIGLPRATSEERRAASHSPPSEPIHGPEDRRTPDIVLITLDAARADHFGCYGYPRATTPNIDRLAGESLVFRNAFALAPYTLNSVATIISGLSFLDHGVVAKGDTLGDEATTMAESLKRAGYRTVCFSSTPNNGISRNFHQGYDEFFEVWRTKSGLRNRDPHLLSRQVVRWLSTYDDPAPLHMQLHYVPPHGPYTPPRRFDLFSEAGYRGRFNGESTTLWAINDRRLRPAKTDLDQIVALYDGNLRAADDAVGMVLDALRRRPRWRRTVVLVTADHGEAFFEHGMMSHSSTVYGEMLQVPFILRTPPSHERPPIDTCGLVSLADIVPTLLGTVGSARVGPTEGTDLLRASDQNPRRGRYLVTRNGNELPLLGFRSLRWSAILAPTGHGELYDLASDPEEVRDLYLEEPARFAGLALLISRRVDRPPSVSGPARRADIDDEERSMLEELGYIE